MTKQIFSKRHGRGNNQNLKLRLFERNPVLRSEGNKNGEFEPKAYNVFSPKILATRKAFADVALESRCITERVRPKDRKDIPSSFAG